MRMKKAVLALLAGGLLLPAAGFAGRLDGHLLSEDQDTGDLNESCIVVEGEAFSVTGVVEATNAGCIARVSYYTPLPHKASASDIKSGKTEGSTKVSQNTEATMRVEIVDETLASCANDYVGDATPEKCKASASAKASDAEVVDSSKVSVSCELGANGSELTPAAPSQTQIDTITAAFADRKDVKFEAPKKGKVTIKQKGIEDATATVPCHGF